jgi:hypothetical protein
MVNKNSFNVRERRVVDELEQMYENDTKKMRYKGGKKLTVVLL